MNVEGLITESSSLNPKEAADRIEAEICARGMTVFARINHSTLATEVEMDLRPTEVILFGNPRGGTPLMQTAQTMGIDLPLKILVWQDAAARTWISYNEPAWVAKRHGLSSHEAETSAKLAEAIQAITATVGR